MDRQKADKIKYQEWSLQKYRDVHLSEMGLLQANLQQPLVNSIKLNPVVLVSPHIRTI